MSDVLDRLRNKLEIRYLVFAEEELRAICDAVDAQRAELKRLRVVERNYNRVAATTLSAVEGCECAICTGELALEDIDHHQLVASEAKAVADAAELRAQRDVLAKAFQAEVFGAGTYSIAEAKECGDAVKAWAESQKGPANAG